MSTFVKPAVRFTSLFLLGSVVFWLVTLVCERLYSCHVTFLDEKSKLEDELWLRIQCQDPVFYSNIKGHTNICGEVERNARRNLYLFAFTETLKRTNLCGGHSCVDMLKSVLTWFASLSLPLMALVVVLSFMPIALVGRLVVFVVDVFRYERGEYRRGFPSLYSVPVQPPDDFSPLTRYPVYRLPPPDFSSYEYKEKGV